METTSRYVRAALEFAEAAMTPGQTQHGKRIVQGAARFLRDLERTDAPFTFDEAYADHACRWIEQIPHVEGKWATPVIRLEPFQCFALVQLFGFRLRVPLPDSTLRLGGVEQPFRPRRFTSMLYCVARKNAKSTIAAAIGLYIQCTEPEQGQQLYSAATTFQQALPIFATAKRMVEKCWRMRDKYSIIVWAKQLTIASNGSAFKPLHAKASTQDGLNPSVVLIDEVHAHKSPDLINVLTSAAGARSSPYFGYFTTEGYINGNSPWADIRSFADKVLSGVFDADHHLVIFFSVDKDDDDYEESAWVKANPLLLTNPHLLGAIRKESIEAKGMPSKLAEFRIKRLNRESNPPHAWIALEAWNKCDSAPVTLEDFDGLETFGGLDLSSTTDLAVFRIAAQHPERGLITMGWRWTPERAVKLRTERGTVPYAAWTAAGILEPMPGEVIDQRIIKEKIIEISGIVNLLCVGIDPWNGRQIAGELAEADITVMEFIQGAKSYHPVMQSFEAMYLSGHFAHGDDPLLRWCASNLVLRYDVNLNMAPDRKRAPEKIDDMVALLIALGAMMSGERGNDMSGVFNDPITG